MKKFTLFVASLLLTVGAMAQIRVERDVLLANQNGNGQYEWTSDAMTAPEGEFKTLRVTFLENSNNETPAGFPCIAIAEFYLYDKDGNQVPLTVDRFSSNATETNEGKSSLAELCDGFTTQQDGEGVNDWYWHSFWSNANPTPWGFHYLQINLEGIEADLSTYKIGWVTRRQQASPAVVAIAAGASDEDVVKKTTPSYIAEVSGEVINDVRDYPTFYTIRSIRSKKYLAYSADDEKPVQQENLTDACRWYFTEGENGALVLRNYSTNQVLGNDYTMSEDGEWFVTPSEFRNGVVISKTTNVANWGCIDANNNNNGIGEWYHVANDSEGTTWLIQADRKFLESADCAVSELNGKFVASIGQPATAVEPGKWYILNNAGRNAYVSQEGNNRKMRAKNNLIEGMFADVKAGYLFKIVMAEDGEHFNIMSGNGRYFTLSYNGSATSLKPVNYEIKLIGESTDNFSIFDAENNYAADGQEIGNNFVGWSSSVPSSAGGNDSYKLLPVEFADIMVEDGYYYIKGTGTGNNAAWYMSYNGDKWNAEEATAGVKHIWKIEANGEGYTMMSCNLNKYAELGNATSLQGGPSSLVDNGAKFAFFNVEGDKFIIKSAGNVVRTENAGAVNYWSGETGETWQLIPATEVEVTVNEFASICLPFAVEVEDATAYAVEEIGTESVKLAEKADIPAGEGAILAGKGTATLSIVAKAATDWSKNLLEGTTVDTYVAGNAYVLANGTEGIGLYAAELNKDAEGNDGTTHFKNNANKAYLPVAEGASLTAAFYGFNWNGTTGVENVEVENEVKAIYDLTGRKVETISAPGIYIINGVKRVVR